MLHSQRTTLALFVALSTSACFEEPDASDLGPDGSSSGGDTESPESSTSGEPGDGSTTSSDPADGTDESGDPPPGDEVCNGLDDDGDGVVDVHEVVSSGRRLE